MTAQGREDYCPCAVCQTEDGLRMETAVFSRENEPDCIDCMDTGEVMRGDLILPCFDCDSYEWNTWTERADDARTRGK